MPRTDTTFERLAMPTAVQHQAIELISGQLEKIQAVAVNRNRGTLGSA